MESHFRARGRRGPEPRGSAVIYSRSPASGWHNGPGGPPGPGQGMAECCGRRHRRGHHQGQEGGRAQAPRTELPEGDPLPKGSCRWAGSLLPGVAGGQLHFHPLQDSTPHQPTLGAQLPLMHPGCKEDGSVGAQGCQATPGWGQETAPASDHLPPSWRGTLSGLPASSLPTSCSHSCSWDTSPAGHHLSHLSWAVAMAEAPQ